MALEDQDDKELEPGSSDGTETLDAATEAPEGATAEDAGSSTANDVGAADALSIVRDVVADRKAEQPAGSSPEGSEAGDDAGDSTSKELDNENFSDVPFHKHVRFRQLLQQRNEFKVDAERYRNVQGFLDKQGLSAEEAADGLTIMARAKVDPAGAWQQIRPWVQKLLAAAGEVLPADLADRVQRGEITQDAAFELSRSRAQVQSVTARQEFERQQTERQTASAHEVGLYNAAADWEQDRRRKDPGFDAKLIPLQKEIAFLQLQEGKPNTAEGVKDQLVRAYKAVNAALPAAAPAPRTQTRPAIKPVMGGQVSGAVREAKPKTTLEIIQASRHSARA